MRNYHVNVVMNYQVDRSSVRNGKSYKRTWQNWFIYYT